MPHGRLVTIGLAALGALALTLGCGGGAGTDPGTATGVRTLGSGMGTIQAVALGSRHVYAASAVGAGASIQVWSRTAVGAGVSVATTTGPVSAMAPYGDGCLYIDSSERTVNYVSAAFDPIVLNRSAGLAPRDVGGANSNAYWISGAGDRLNALTLPDAYAADSPPPPLEFPRTIAHTTGAMRLAATTGRVWLADTEGARISWVAAGGGDPTSYATGLGGVLDLAASGATVAAATPDGLQVGASLLPQVGVQPSLVGVATAGTVFATPSAARLRSGTGATTLLVATSGLVDLDCAGAALVLGENAPGGGRVRIATIP